MSTSTILGIQADLAELFHPDQWVNVYDAVTGGFFCECQVQHLVVVLMDREPADYHLQPTDEAGVAMALNEALRLGREYRAKQTGAAGQVRQIQAKPRWFI